MRKYQKGYQKKWRLKRRNQGYCLCGKPRVTAWLCEKCSEQNRARNRTRYRRVTSIGLCLCGKQAKKGKKSCVRCLIKGREQALERYNKNPNAHNERARLLRAQLKLDVLQQYGGRCVCCGEMQIEFLTIDHIIPWSENRKTGWPRAGLSLYFRLRRENFPGGFRCLCMNCNWARGTWGRCPHEQRAVSTTLIDHSKPASGSSEGSDSSPSPPRQSHIS